ncbi:hypothetical protein [Propionivibrio sp.]|uniref:hypothetical protein n=1 Tax=Propionivibrio sp. TaxID=2212460 RepID=UPI003BF2D65A
MALTRRLLLFAKSIRNSRFDQGSYVSFADFQFDQLGRSILDAPLRFFLRAPDFAALSRTEIVRSGNCPCQRKQADEARIREVLDPLR